MRYQEPIYIQNNNEAVRNKDILNVNMSSDLCVFETPVFNLSGASKISCTGGTSGTSYIVSAGTKTIPLTFEFTGNTNTFTANSATFKFEVYKYSNGGGKFYVPPVYKSEIIQYSAFSATNSITQSIPVSDLGLDGEYLVKGYYNFPICTEFMGKLGKTIDTLAYRSGSEYGLYEPRLDYFFRAIKESEIPKFLSNSSNTIPVNSLYQQVILPPSGSTTIIVTDVATNSDFVVTLNGLSLAKNLDYTVMSGNVVTLNSPTVVDDIITVIYTTGKGSNIVATSIDVTTPVTSGSTNGEGNNNYYYNTTTGKYEIYTNTTPMPVNTIIVMINGVTLANGIDYYPSTTNSKRIILEGNILVGDVILIIYIPQTSVINGLTTNIPLVSWSIFDVPQMVNGFFSLEVSLDNTFNTLYSTTDVTYVIGQGNYGESFVASGKVGTTLYYRVKNEKNFTTLCGDIVKSIAYSESIPTIIQVNSINSY